VAVTVGPGLALCLMVGVKKALQIAAEHQLPLVACHHMEAHAMVTRLPTAAADPSELPQFPFVTVLVSGGHNMVLLSRGLGSHVILGSTLDDSIGETFDKTARLLGSPPCLLPVGLPCLTLDLLLWRHHQNPRRSSPRDHGDRGR